MSLYFDGRSDSKSTGDNPEGMVHVKFVWGPAKFSASICRCSAPADDGTLLASSFEELGPAGDLLGSYSSGGIVISVMLDSVDGTDIVDVCLTQR